MKITTVGLIKGIIDNFKFGFENFQVIQYSPSSIMAPIQSSTTAHESRATKFGATQQLQAKFFPKSML